MRKVWFGIGAIFCIAGLVYFIIKYPLFDDTRKLNINHPFNGAVFPTEFPAPLFEWWSESRDSTSYEIELYTSNGKLLISQNTKEQIWKPREDLWDSLKMMSGSEKIIFRVRRSGEMRASTVNFAISPDSVGAPILYRQMPIPFLVAEKKLDSMNFMLINVGSSQRPHIAMKGFPVCGNCHSFTADGNTIGLDLDAGLRDKGGYFVSPIQDTILFNIENYRSWSRFEKRRTFGLFSKISPDGRYIVTTVKDRVVIKNFPFTSVENLIYSQLFFPVNGHLAVLDRATNVLIELPGANLEEFVQSNAIWTPDGKNIIFSRAPALTRKDSTEIDVKDEQLIAEFVERKRTLKYDLCIIPFNEGKGGEAKLIQGASSNDRSNYFPAISPDGKWIVYCQAENFMLLMPDSRLHIVPTEGGESRELKSNFNSMNSWHSWSPNGKWLVFASKVLSPYTDMFLSHIDNSGNASIPVLIDRARVSHKVINYPEFLNRSPESTFLMTYDFVEIEHINMAVKKGEMEKARTLFKKLESQKLFFFREDCEDLSYLLKLMDMKEESLKYEELAKHTINATVFSR
jgi:hypothetical protein